jgi:Uma2 family endonuclease
MATAITTPMTAEEFFDWANRPENADRYFELENGKVVEMPSPGELHGLLCSWIVHLLWLYVSRRGHGRVLSNHTGLVVRRNPDTVRGPDVMFFPTTRRLEDASLGPVTDVPALVVEVYSPSDKASRLNRRIAQYHTRGVPLVWIVYPEDRAVDVHRPGKAAESLDESDELAAPDVLPDFRCRVADLFALPGQPPAGP